MLLHFQLKTAKKEQRLAPLSNRTCLLKSTRHNSEKVNHLYINKAVEATWHFKQIKQPKTVWDNVA